MKIPELLAPAGNMEKMKMAFLYGADAVYLGGKFFGMRAQSGNFSEAEIAEAAIYAHSLGKKIYVTVNIMPHNEEFAKLPAYLDFLQDAGVDALIVADPGVFRLAKERVKGLPLHVSTQANTVNWAGALFWQELGAERVVLARELSLPEIGEIRKKTSFDIEVFIHGAMCISYSGRCLLSSYMTGRDANQGECAQACRWRYSLLEEQRPGEYFPVFEDEYGTYVFNSRDLCLLQHLPALCRAGVNSFKIEGRMKSVHYVATVVNVYREALDLLATAPEKFEVKEHWLKELAKISHRPYTEGFIASRPDAGGQVYTSSSYRQTHDFVGLAVNCENGFLTIEQRNNIKEGEVLEVLEPSGKISTLKMADMQDMEGFSIVAAPHPQQLFRVPCSSAVTVGALLRRRVEDA